MKKLLPGVVLLTLAACTTNPKKAEDAGHLPKSAATPTVQAGCYSAVHGPDTIVLQLLNAKPGVDGKLVFDNFEKDSSHGSVTGQQQDSLLLVWYNFEAEGMQSHMQIAFKITDTGLIRGNGPMDYRNDSAFFTNMDSIEFPQASLMRHAGCKPFEALLARVHSQQ